MPFVLVDNLKKEIDTIIFFPFFIKHDKQRKEYKWRTL